MFVKHTEECTQTHVCAPDACALPSVSKHSGRSVQGGRTCGLGLGVSLWTGSPQTSEGHRIHPCISHAQVKDSPQLFFALVSGGKSH